MSSILIANCSTAQWTFNSKNQSPCTLVSALGGLCYPDGYSVTPLPDPTSRYLGPLKGYENPCICSSVYYSLISACAICQGDRPYMSWSLWSANCSTTYITTFPKDLPQGFPVPHWAYQNVLVYDTWSQTVAQGDTGPEVSAAPLPPPPANNTSTPTISSTTPTTSQSISSTGHNLGKVDTAALVGGAVGGILGLALIGASLYAFLSIHRRKQSATLSIQSQVHSPEIVHRLDGIPGKG